MRLIIFLDLRPYRTAFPLFGETLPTKDRTIPSWLKRNRILLAATAAGNGKFLTRAVGLRFSFLATIGATSRSVSKAFLLVELLFTGRPNKGVAAVLTG